MNKLSIEVQKLSFLLWSTWKSRNVVVFNNEFFNPMECITKAKRACAEWRIRNCLSVDDFCARRSFGPTSNYKIVQWVPPPSGSVKLNFDGSVQHILLRGATSFVTGKERCSK